MIERRPADTFPVIPKSFVVSFLLTVRSSNDAEDVEEGEVELERTAETEADFSRNESLEERSSSLAKIEGSVETGCE
ncbi:MAG TPA: hypothetical protein VFA93_01900, partial [Patescibacteria group bacterium]|nr:hypothetical protein [Patescibacteria group bacterium]